MSIVFLIFILTYIYIYICAHTREGQREVYGGCYPLSYSVSPTITLKVTF